MIEEVGSNSYDSTEYASAKECTIEEVHAHHETIEIHHIMDIKISRLSQT